MNSSNAKDESPSKDKVENKDYTRVNKILGELKKQNLLDFFHDSELTDDALDYSESVEDMRNVLTLNQNLIKIPSGKESKDTVKGDTSKERKIKAEKEQNNPVEDIKSLTDVPDQVETGPSSGLRSKQVADKIDGQQFSTDMQESLGELNWKADDEWKIHPDLVHLGTPIGRRLFGNVYRGECKGIGPVAIKVLPGRNFVQSMTKVWKTIDHPNVVKLIGVCSDGPWYMISEYMEEGNLMRNLRGSNKPSTLDMISIAVQICQGMKFLESHNFVHCLLNTENILVSGNWNAKIYGVWWCKKMVDCVYIDDGTFTEIFSKWDAPEVIFKGQFSSKSNIWSFGILLSEIITYGYSPYKIDLGNEEGYKMPKPEYVPIKLYETMLACLAKDPADRPSFVEIEKSLTQLECDERYGQVLDDTIYNDAYHRALKDGEAANTRIPVMIVGQDRSGKTSLRKHLQGLPFDAEEPSTCGIEVDVVELTDGNAQELWKRKKMAHFILSQDEATEQVLKQAAHLVIQQPVNPENSEEETVALAESQSVNILQPELSDTGQKFVTDNNITTFADDEHTKLEEPMPESLSKDRIDEIKSLEKNVGSDETPPVVVFLHDLAGQSVFYDTHYYFLKLQCPYIVVHDLQMPFGNPAQPRFKPKIANVERNLNNPLLATNLDFFLSWLTVLNKLREAAGQITTFKLPPVLIALTNSDRFKGDIDAVKQRIKDILTEGGFDNVFIEPYVIDNTSTTGDEVKKLRKKLHELCKLILEKQRPVPIRWLQFEASLSNKIVMEKLTYISLEEAHKVGESCKVQDVNAAIKFLHHQGVIVHHSGSPVVVLNPVWLMNLFTEVITVPQEDNPSNANYRKLVKKGILMQEYVRERDHGEVLEELMLQFGLICPLQHNGQPAFIVPSVAPVMKNGKDVQEKLSTSTIYPLFFHFKRGYILPGIFTRFLVNVIDKCRELLRNDRPRLYCDYTLLSFQYCQGKFDVYAIQQLAGIKIGVVPIGTVNHSDCAKFTSFLKQTMIDCFQSIKDNERLFYQNIDVSLSMKCPVCFGETAPCLRHGNENCTNDYCGHFWTLEELQGCTEDPVCDFASVVETLVFPLQRVKPWLGLGDDPTNPVTIKLTINDLDLLKRQKICKKLNIIRVVGGDFRELAAHLDMCCEDLELISQQSDPTDAVLTWAAGNPRITLPKLRQILMDMKRADCVEIIDECPVTDTNIIIGSKSNKCPSNADFQIPSADAEKSSKNAKPEKPSPHGLLVDIAAPKKDKSVKDCPEGKVKNQNDEVPPEIKKTFSKGHTENIPSGIVSKDIVNDDTSKEPKSEAEKEQNNPVEDIKSLTDVPDQVETEISNKNHQSFADDEKTNGDDTMKQAKLSSEIGKFPENDANANLIIGSKSNPSTDAEKSSKNAKPTKPSPLVVDIEASKQDCPEGKVEKQNDEVSPEIKKTFCTRKPFGKEVEDFCYIKGTIFKEAENHEIEFKALTKETPEKLPWKIMEKAKVFICGILNAGGKGTIYFGIGDSYDKTNHFNHGEVIGLEVEELKDEINKAFQATLDDHIQSDNGKMKTRRDMNCVKIYFVPVEKCDERTGHYVIEIEINREWKFCEDNVYYFKIWIEKQGTILKTGLNDLYTVKKDKWEDPFIRTCGSSRPVKNFEIDKDIKQPLTQKYKEWQSDETTSRRALKRLPSYEVADTVDVQKFSTDLRESLRELNWKVTSYILIANTVPPQYRASNALAFLQSIPWIAVFDLFDPHSKKDGLHFIFNETSDSARATLKELGDFKELSLSEDMSTLGTTWIYRNQSMYERDWTRNSKDCLYRALSAYHKRSPTGRIHCVFLGLSEENLQEMADIIDSCFSIIGNNASRCISVISEKKEIGNKIVKLLKPDVRKDVKPPCSMFGFPLEILKDNVKEMLGPIHYEEPGATTDLPYSNGKPRPVLNKRLKSLTDLELYFPKPKLVHSLKAIEKARENFYMGDVIKQLNLFHDHDIERTLAAKVTSRVDQCLKKLSDLNETTRHVEIVTLSYESGSGATTLCRRILWGKKEAYRCAVVKTIGPNTDYQIDELQKFLYETSPPFIPPVLALVDNLPEYQVRQLIDKMSERETKCVILNTIPIATFKKDTYDDVSELGQLDETEIEKVQGILVDVTAKDGQKEAAVKVLERERRFIWLGLELFGREYYEIEPRLSKHINDIISHNLSKDETLKDAYDSLKDAYEMILRFCCLLDFYSKGRSIYPHPCVADILFDRGGLDKDDMNQIDKIHDKFGGLLLEDNSESEGYRGWRPAHFLVGEVVRKEMNLVTTAQKLMVEMNTGSSYARKYLTNDTVNVFLQRDKKFDSPLGNTYDPDFALDGSIPMLTNIYSYDDEFRSLKVQTRYSALIMDVMSSNPEIPSDVLNALNLLITLNEKVTTTQHKARIWQQIARVFAYEIGMEKISKKDFLVSLVERITKLVCPGRCPSASPTNGFDIAHLVIDEAIKLQESYVHHLVTKGAFFMAKLRDLREVKNHVIGSEELDVFIQEAINTSKKGIKVYDAALEKTSPDGYLHAMVGKINTVIVLLEILKLLPFFAQHNEGPDKSFKDYMTLDHHPENLKATLSKDDLDYFISLRSIAIQLLNDLFREIKLRRTQSYKSHEIQELTNAKIRAMKHRKKFYQVTGLDRTNLTSDTGYKEDIVNDHLYKFGETPYSGWTTLPQDKVALFYDLLKKAIPKETVHHEAMLIFARAALQENVNVDELSNHVELWCRMCPRSVWANMFKYMIHFPVPNGSLKANISIVKSSVAVCKSNLRQGHRKSGAEYFLGKGVGLHSIIPSHEVSKVNQEVKTKFWRSTDVFAKLERLCGQKILGRKGVLTYREIEIMFDNARYPKESRDNLWFCLGFTVNGPYAYDPIEEDVYEQLNKSFSDQEKGEQPQFSLTARDHGSGAPPLATFSPEESRRLFQTPRGRSYATPKSISRPPATAKSPKMKSSYASTVSGDHSMPKGPRNPISPQASWKDKQRLIIRKRTGGGLQKTFDPIWVDDEGKVHHGAFVKRAKKSSECRTHTEEPTSAKCPFAHSWKGDSILETVCLLCTDNKLRYCNKLEEHTERICVLGPYLNDAGETWVLKIDPEQP